MGFRCFKGLYCLHLQSQSVQEELLYLVWQLYPSWRYHSVPAECQEPLNQWHCVRSLMTWMFGNTAMRMSGLHVVFLSLWMWFGIVFIVLVHDETKPMWCTSKYQRLGDIKPQHFVHLIWCYPCLHRSDWSNCFCTPPFIIPHFFIFIFYYTCTWL